MVRRQDDRKPLAVPLPQNAKEFIAIYNRAERVADLGAHVPAASVSLLLFPRDRYLMHASAQSALIPASKMNAIREASKNFPLHCYITMAVILAHR